LSGGKKVTLNWDGSSWKLKDQAASTAGGRERGKCITTGKSVARARKQTHINCIEKTYGKGPQRVKNRKVQVSMKNY